jgi:selenocysteine-specific elongation factor
LSSVVLGTAGHIDHGKTALVRALTGTDTDRLKEEKARGITIELGFAELASEGRPHFGVVDVPGHEAFVRAMVAGAAGMDIVLLVVAADEGVMPQTREHLAIVELLGVPELVVALTKSDAVEDEWLELVDAEVAETLATTPYAAAPRIPTSAHDGTGLDTLLEALSSAAERVRRLESEDLVRLPLDRVFTIQGTGTVVTGTLWSGSLAIGDRVRILPDDLDGRIRSLQVHERVTESAKAGDRTAVALTGDGADREVVSRGATLVTSPVWNATWMLTTKVRMLADAGWNLEHNQRVHVHHGTAEVLARCVLLESGPLTPGQSGWVQIRLEKPLVARVGDRFVIRAYSPVTTIGGGVVAEADAPKRKGLDEEVRSALEVLIAGGAPDEALAACLRLAGWSGVKRASLPVQLGIASVLTADAIEALQLSGGLVAGDRMFSSSVREQAEKMVLDAVDTGHSEDSLRPAIPLAPLRAALPRWAPPELAGAVIAALVADGRVESLEGGVRRPDHQPKLTGDQESASEELIRVLTADGLAAPLVEELPEEMRLRSDFWSLLRRLESLGTVRQVADGYYVGAQTLAEADERVRDTLAGRTGLGPADFREALPVTRKHLIPLLNYLDGQGTTIRTESGRDVPNRI